MLYILKTQRPALPSSVTVFAAVQKRLAVDTNVEAAQFIVPTFVLAVNRC
jgi:hypothetical protein